MRRIKKVELKQTLPIASMPKDIAILIDDMENVLYSDVSNYRLSKGTDFDSGALSRLRTGKKDLATIRLQRAISLASYSVGAERVSDRIYHRYIVSFADKINDVLYSGSVKDLAQAMHINRFGIYKLKNGKNSSWDYYKVGNLQLNHLVPYLNYWSRLQSQHEARPARFTVKRAVKFPRSWFMNLPRALRDVMFRADRNLDRNRYGINLAERTGLNRVTLYALRSGGIRKASLATCIRLADYRDHTARERTARAICDDAFAVVGQIPAQEVCRDIHVPLALIGKLVSSPKHALDVKIRSVIKILQLGCKTGLLNSEPLNDGRCSVSYGKHGFRLPSQLARELGITNVFFVTLDAGYRSMTISAERQPGSMTVPIGDSISPKSDGYWSYLRCTRLLGHITGWKPKQTTYRIHGAVYGQFKLAVFQLDDYRTEAGTDKKRA